MKRHFLYLMILPALLLTGCDGRNEPDANPEDSALEVQTGAATVDENEVRLEGAVVAEPADALRAGFRIAKTRTELAAAEVVEGIFSDATRFYAVIPGMENGEYWYEAVVTSGGQTFVGKTGWFAVEFTTVPDVTTGEATFSKDGYLLTGTYALASKKVAPRPGFFYAATSDGLDAVEFMPSTADGDGNFSLQVPDNGIGWFYQAAVQVGSAYYRGRIREARVTNLSQEGLANCYVVPKAGLYCFEPKRPDGTMVEGSEVAWLMAAPGQNLSDLRFEDGLVLFTASGEIGNETIALLKDGAVQWSWHIWTPGELNVQTFNGVNILDRNLGARDVDASNPASVGFYYQWGRKDPFPGTRQLSRSYATAEQYEGTAFGLTGDRVYTEPYLVNEAVTGSNLIVHRSTEMTWEAAIANPTTHYGKYAAGGWAAANADIADYWGGESKKMTNQNPCPAGYRVPTMDELVSYFFGLEKAEGASVSYPSNSWGHVISYNGDTFQFPAGRFRAWSGLLMQPGNPTCYMSSTVSTTEKKFSFLWNFNGSVAAEPTCEAMPVRCIGE